MDVSGQKYLQLTYRQRSGGTGPVGVNYTVGDLTYVVEVSTSMTGGSWLTDVSLVEQIGTATSNGDGTDTVTVRLRSPLDAAPKKFVRLRILKN